VAISRIKGPCGWGLEVRLGRFGFAIGRGNIVATLEGWRRALAQAHRALVDATRGRDG
jgi:hypothetical protein